MNVYIYHPDTGEYLTTEPAETNPMAAGEYLIPAYSTTIAPPVLFNRKFANVFSEESNTWSTVPDHRGKTYWTVDGAVGAPLALGVPLPAGHSLTPPPPPPAVPTADAAVAILNSWIDRVAEQVTREYPAIERASWATQDVAGRQYLRLGDDGTTAEHLALLDAIRLSSETRQYIAESIVAKADAYTAIVGALGKFRRETSYAIASGTTPEQWESIIVAARASAITELAQFGLVDPDAEQEA